MDPFEEMTQGGMGPIPAGLKAEDTGNLQEFEMQFAVKAVEHAETYWRMLGVVDPVKMKFTSIDDEILSSFQETFPEYNSAEKLIKLDEEEIKSPAGKAKWRKWIEKFKGDARISEYNFGTLVRTNCFAGFSEENTMFLIRMQFYAFELARCRAGLNAKAHDLSAETPVEENEENTVEL